MTERDAVERLVTLPGMDGTGELHRAFTDALGERLTSRRIAYPREAWAYDELAELVARELEVEASAGDYLLLADSFSGPIGLRMAAARAPGLRGLVLVATFAEAPPSPLLPLVTSIPPRLLVMDMVPCWAACQVMLNADSPPGAREGFCQVIKAVSQRAVSGRLEEVQRLTPPPGPIRLPALYIQAENDRILPKRAALAGVRRALPELEVFRLPGPHLILSASPEVCADRVAAFARRVSTGGHDPRADRTSVAE